MKSTNYKSTLSACFFSYISQAIVVNLPPLLFVLFSQSYGISLDKIGLLVTIGFTVQIITDLVFSKLAIKLGYRLSAILAHALCVGGLILLGFLPRVMSPFTALIIAFVIMSIGGGLIEVLISPMVDSLPAKSKSAAMSLLHSFYCWGAVLVIIVSTLLFLTPLKNVWYILPSMWAVLPAVGLVLFCLVPFPPRQEETVTPYKKLFTSKIFYVMIVLMICAGASEQAVAQWASLFAEMGLNVNKTTGNLLGAAAFATLMGITRVIYGILGGKINLKKALMASGAVCVIAYVLMVFVPVPAVNLLGCALSGIGVGIFWPGVISYSARRLPTGGTTMFALLALGGDIGCAIGPGLVGLVSDAVIRTNSSWFGGLFGSGEVAGLKTGLMFAIIFPICLIITLLLLKNKTKTSQIGTALFNNSGVASTNTNTTNNTTEATQNECTKQASNEQNT